MLHLIVTATQSRVLRGRGGQRHLRRDTCDDRSPRGRMIGFAARRERLEATRAGRPLRSSNL